MAKSIFIFLFLLLFLFLSTNPVLFQLNNGFVYNGFKGFTDNNNISLNGVVEIHNNGLLQLTNDTLRLIGHVFYPTPIRFKDSTAAKALSFSIAFAFAIVLEYKKLGGHGFRK
ncbi:hypothetical protein CsSME_00012983 [Camellia sinensis var. sinensis]